MANQKQLSSDQIERIKIALNALEARDKNTFAQLFALVLKRAITPDKKRAAIASAYAECYSVMLSIDMAINSEVSPDEFRKAMKQK